jgi:parallel beta-helix repeat protein
MKQLFVILFLVLTVQKSIGSTYYFSSSLGNDSRTSTQAQDPATPWKTLNKLNAFFNNLQPGDSVVFKRGDFFSGSITISRSGSAGLPITLSAYGNGNKPVITGLVNLSNWVSAGNGVWESANSSLGNSTNVLILNGVPQEMGRYPNSNAVNKGYLNIDSHTSGSITDAQLSGNWTGAEVVIRKKHWIIDRQKITNQAGQTISFDASTSTYDPIDNFGYFIQNSRQTLDQFGEWYYNVSQKKMVVYFGANSPSGYILKASTVDNLIRVMNHDNILIDNLTFEGANTNAIFLYNADNVRIANCNISFSGYSGVNALETTNLHIENCSVKYSNNDGFDLRNNNDNASVRNNKIENTHLFAGMGQSGDGNGIGILAKGQRMLVEYNQIFNTGYIGISFGGDYTVIKNNFINSFCLVKDDGGGIYTFSGQTANVPNVGRKVIGNVILNGIGAGEGTLDPSHRLAHGIMFDDNVTGVEVNGNTIANVNNNGIFLQYCRNIAIKNNTVFNNGTELYMSYGQSALAPISGNKIFSNIFFSRLPTQMLSTFTTNTTEINFGSFDSNYYARPVGENVATLNTYSNGAGGMVENPYDLDRWKKYKKEDLNAKSSPVTIPEYTVKSLVGANKFGNGDFNTNINGIGSYSPANDLVKSFNSSGVLDNGSLAIAFKKTSGPKKSSLVMRDIGPISSNKNYILRYSLKGSNDNVAMAVYLRNSKAPFNNLTKPQYRKISSVRTENEVLFSLPPSADGATMVFKIDNPNVQFWLDNIEFYEANIQLTNADNYIRFEYNASNSNKTVSLNGNYVDAKNQFYSGSLVLPPYSSVVLIKKAGNFSKTDQTIAFDSIPDKTFGDDPFDLSATATSGLDVNYRIVSGPATISDNTVQVSGVGTVVVEAMQSGNASYNAAPPVQQTFVVSKADQTINFLKLSSKAFGDAPFDVNATASSDLPVSFRIVSGPATLSDNTVTITGVGVVVVEATQQGNNTYKAANPVRQSFTVRNTVQAQTINFPAISPKSYGDDPFKLSATASSGLPVSFDVISGDADIADDNTITVNSPGTVVVEASQDGDGNFDAATPVRQSFVVGKGDQAISFPTIPAKNDGDQPFTVNASSSSGLPVALRIVSGPAQISGRTITITGIGPVTVEATQAGNRFYNAAPAVRQSFTVEKDNQQQDQTINFYEISDKSYGDAPFPITAKASSGLPVSFQVVSGEATISEDNVVSLHHPGVIVIQASQDGNDEYNPANPVTQTFVVQKGDQSITLPAIPTKTLGDDPFVVPAWSSSGLPVALRIVSGPATLSNNTVTVTGTGTVIVGATLDENDYYNSADPVTQSFSVQQGSQLLNQTIAFSPIPSKNYGDDPFAINATASSGLPVTFRIVSGEATIDNGNLVSLHYPGTVVIEASQPGDGNYNAADPVTQTLIVNKDEQVITFPDIASKTYGDDPFTVPVWSSSGLPVSLSVVSGPAKISKNTITLTGAGTVVLEASQDGNGYYNDADVVTQSFNVLSSTRGQARMAVTAPAPQIAANKSNSITAYPNPFRTVATVEVYSSEEGPATLELYDLAGRLVKRLFKGNILGGVSTTFSLSSEGLLEGEYVLRLNTRSKVETKKIVLAR